MALLSSMALVTYMSAPASAHGTGVTTGGESNVDVDEPNQTPPLCLLATGTVITLYNTGTFNDTSAVSHRAIFTATEDYYFGPGGTYSDSSCTTPDSVTGTLTVQGGGSSVHCNQTSATYQRVSTAYTITTTSPTTCYLTGSTGAHTSNLTYTGVQLACGADPITNIDPCDDPPGPTQSPEFTGTYAQT